MTRGFVAPRPTGPTSARLHGAVAILDERAQTAWYEAQQLPKADQRAAALRGKARAYREAIDLLRRLDQGRPLSNSADRRRPRLWPQLHLLGRPGAR